MPSYDDIKDFIVSNVEEAVTAAPTDDNGNSVLFGLQAALGKQTKDNGDFIVLTYVSKDSDGEPVTVSTVLAGSALSPAADRKDPSTGPNTDKADRTVIAEVIRGIAGWFTNNWATKINALITEANDRWGTELETLE